MVGRRSLEAKIGVRIPVSELNFRYGKKIHYLYYFIYPYFYFGYNF